MKLGGFQRLLLAFAAILCFVLASPSEAFGQSMTVSERFSEQTDLRSVL